MLLDAHSLIYRAYFALLETPLTTSKGQLVNAAFGFWSIVLRGFADMKPDHVMCCFDVGRSFRADRYEGYKATRRPTPDDLRDQFPIVRETLAAFGIPIYELPGYEADDLIGSLSRQAELRDLETIIVSGDLDMLQLVTERTKLMTTRLGVQSTVIYDPARIHERYGLDPGQMIDFKALKGDSTDNIPGIPGVGDKTAAKLLVDFGSLEGIFARLDEVRPDKLRDKLRDHRDDVLLWRELVTIDRLAPIALDLEGARLGDYDRSEVVRLFREYEFRSLVDRLPGQAADAGRADAEPDEPMLAAMVPGRARQRPAPRAPAEGSGLQLTLDFGAVAAPAARCQPPGAASPGLFDGPETEPATDVQDSVVARSTAAVRRHAPRAQRAESRWRACERCWPTHPASSRTRATWLAGWRPSRSSSWAPCSTTRARAAARSWASPWPAPTAASWPPRARPPRPSGRRSWPPVGRSSVTRSSRCWSGSCRGATRPRASSLSASAGILPRGRLRHAGGRLHPQRGPAQPVAGGHLRGAAGRRPARGRASCDAADAGGRRGGRRRRRAGRARRRPRGRARRCGASSTSWSCPWSPVLADMEATGVALDRAALAALAGTFREAIDRLAEDIYASVGHEFNLGSPKQLEQVLFYELDLPRGKRTKTGYSTDAQVLEELRAAHPMIPHAARLAHLHQAPLHLRRGPAAPHRPDAPAACTPRFQQAVAATGRLSSADPNLQNIPIRTELGRRIRSAFVAGGEDLVLLAADYSQIELRVLAHVSGDAHLREAFEQHADIHRQTAARVLQEGPRGRHAPTSAPWPRWSTSASPTA